MSNKRVNSSSGRMNKKQKANSSQKEFPCNECTDSFETSTQLNGHIHDTHTAKAEMTLTEGSNKIKYRIERNEAFEFECEICKEGFVKKSTIRRHLFVVSRACASKILQSRLDLDNSSLEASPEPEPVQWRSFDDAVLHATGKETEGESERVRMLYVAEKFDQFPIGFSVQGEEKNALVTGAVNDALPDKPFLAMINKSTRSNQHSETLPCLTCNPVPVPPIADLIQKTPFAKILGKRRYEELSKERTDDLNLNWVRYPEARQVAGHMLAGAILYNAKTGKGILINEVEVYGRGRMEDCHREQSGIVKDVPKQTSVPSTVGDDHYEGVRPVTLPAKDCRRLVIGTKTCDVLVTSCLRLGIRDKAPVSVGADTLNFEIPESEVEHIRIFLDCKQAEVAKNLVGKSISEITKNMGMESLRQLQTKFDELDTYDLCRFSGPLTATIRFQPRTLFTFANYKNGTGAAYGAGRLFYAIGKAVICHGEKATLSRKEVMRNQEMCRGSKEFLAPFEKIALLFGQEEQEIAIIGNAALSDGLKDLAATLSKRVAEANTKEIKPQVQALFGVVVIKEKNHISYAINA